MGTPISGLTLGTVIDEANDLLVYVDVSDLTGSPQGTTKKIEPDKLPVTNIYSASGTLTASRVMTMAGFNLEFRQSTALLTIDAANFGVIAGGNTVSTSTILEASSTTKGFLMPRMTTAQKNAITTPPTSLFIFDTDLNAFNFNSGTPGSPVWSGFGGAGDGNGIYDGNGSLSGNTTVTCGGSDLNFNGTNNSFRIIDAAAFQFEGVSNCNVEQYRKSNGSGHSITDRHYLEDSISSKTEYTAFRTEIASNVNGSESGRYKLQSIYLGTLQTYLWLENRRVGINLTAAAGAALQIKVKSGDDALRVDASVNNALLVANSGKVSLTASVAGNATFNIPQGATPSTPVNGDIWTTAAGLFVRIAGSTVGPLS